MIQQASASAFSNGSISGTLSSYSASQSQASTVYGISQGPGSQYDAFQTQGRNQLCTAHEVTASQQATEGATMVNGSSPSFFSASVC